MAKPCSNGALGGLAERGGRPRPCEQVAVDVGVQRYAVLRRAAQRFRHANAVVLRLKVHDRRPKRAHGGCQGLVGLKLCGREPRERGYVRLGADLFALQAAH